MTAPRRRLLRLTARALGLLCLAAPSLPLGAQTVFINEFHYDNDSTDTGEGVEIAGPAGTDLAEYALYLYNGSNGAPYSSPVALSGIIPNLGGTGSGAIWFPVSGLQNGDPDGLALVRLNGNTVVQLIGYDSGPDGPFTGASGPAAGLVFPDTGVGEPGSGNPPGRSLQLTGTGTTAADFVWSGPAAASPGALNAGQTFGAVPPSAILTLSPGLVREGGTATGSLTFFPPPAAPVLMALEASRPGLAQFPATVTVPVSGTVSFTVTIPADGMASGFRETAVTATPPAADPPLPSAAAALQIIDADRPALSAPGMVRLAAFNVRQGIGAPGSPEFAALRGIIERLSPDILVMQEVSDRGDFGDARALLEQAGFPSGPAHAVWQDDSFAGQTYNSGDFGDGDCLITASRYPITATVQIGRGIAGRRELTRYPLYTRISLPDTDGSLHLVNVHLKAGTSEPDRFRKAVEAWRIREFLASRSLAGGTDNVIIAGDFNAIDTIYLPPLSFNTATWTPPAGTSLPASWQLGADLAASPGITLPYSVAPYDPSGSVFPHQGFNSAGLYALPLFQADGVNPSTFNLFDARFDYLFLASRLQTGGHIRGEVYNSRLEPQADGLPKALSLPPPDLSTTASDHHPVFADLPLLPPVSPASPVLRLTVSPAERDESSTAPPPAAVVSLSPPPAAPVTVRLAPWRQSRVHCVPDTVTLTPAQPSGTVRVEVPFSALAEPFRAISLTATAPGHLPAFASLLVKSYEPGGLLVISQYIEPPASPGPAPDNNTSRAVELYNASGTLLDLTRLKWEVRRWTNGSLSPVTLARVAETRPAGDSAPLPAGRVVVIGEASIGESLVTAGLLPSSHAGTFAAASTGTLFLNAAGEAVFLKGSNMDFNGDDALDVVADGLRCDVFGTPGQDPGTAWTGGPDNPSTADGNLTLRPSILTGSPGFTLPGTRFHPEAGGGSLAGLGIPPVPADRYLAWAEARGLAALDLAPNRDPDADGRFNLIEFLHETDPLRPDSPPGALPASAGPPAPAPPAATARFPTLNPDPWLAITWEHSGSLAPAALWEPAAEVTPVPDGAGRTFWEWSLPSGSTLPRRFWRMRATRP